MFNLIAIPFGWLMRLIYQLVHSYGISIFLFTIVIKLITLPSTYKMQVNQARQSLVAPRIAKLKKAYPNNPQRVQEEQNKIYSEEGINPSAGCLGSFLTIFLILGVYRVVLQPLTYILRIPHDTIQTAVDTLKTWMEQNGLATKYLTARPELMLLNYAKSNPEIFSDMGDFASKLAGFENSFLGFDLAGVPTLKPENGWGFTAVMLVMLPVLSALINLVSSIVTQAHNKKANPAAAETMNSMNMMLYLSPLMTIWIGMSVPAGLSFYWLVNSVLTLLTTLLIYRYLSGKRLEAINEKEKQKQLAKGPTWMQRMMEQSAQYTAQQQGGGQRSDANRSRYADGDDGMSKKERQEYERKLIEAARKRAALKYGDAMPDEEQTGKSAK